MNFLKVDKHATKEDVEEIKDSGEADIDEIE